MTREKVIKILEPRQRILPGFLVIRFRNGSRIRAHRTSMSAVRGFSAPILCIADRISSNESTNKNKERAYVS